MSEVSERAPLILKPSEELGGYIVTLKNGRHIGRIYEGIGSVPKDTRWFWGLEFHGWTQCKCSRPQYGYATNREEAMTAFRATWESGNHY